MYYFLLGWFQNVFGLILGFGKFSSYLAESFEGMKFRKIFRFFLSLKELSTLLNLTVVDCPACFLPQ